MCFVVNNTTPIFFYLEAKPLIYSPSWKLRGIGFDFAIAMIRSIYKLALPQPKSNL